MSIGGLEEDALNGEYWLYSLPKVPYSFQIDLELYSLPYAPYELKIEFESYEFVTFPRLVLFSSCAIKTAPLTTSHNLFAANEHDEEKIKLAQIITLFMSVPMLFYIEG